MLHWIIASLRNVGDKGDFATLGVDLSAIEAGRAGYMRARELGNLRARFANAKK